MSKYDELFDLLDIWRNYPFYRLETRVDIFFALYLKILIEKKFETFGYIVVEIIPEIPIKKDLNYRSFKVDFICLLEGKIDVLIVELKTDMKSILDSQERYLNMVLNWDFKDLLEKLLQIYDRTKSKGKYDWMLDRLYKCGYLEKKNGIWDKNKNLPKDIKLTLVHILPKYYEGIKGYQIDFKECSEIILSNFDDEFSKRFARSLRGWVNQPGII